MTASLDYYERYNKDERLCFIYTDRCTAACAHCITESNPRRAAKLDVEHSRHVLDAAGTDGRRLSIFGGGEVFLYYRELLALVHHATALGMDTMVETNAYWATSDAAARAKLGELRERGLKTIHTSADVYRARWVPLARVLRMGRVARELGLQYDICFVYSGDRAADEAILESLRREGLNHSVDTLFPFGSAAELPPGSFVRADVRNHGDCGDLLPTIAPNGDVVACCNTNIHRPGSPLFLGNLRRDPVADLLARHRSSPILNAITTRGFRYFNELVQDDPRLRVALGSRAYRSICEFCHALFSDRGHVERLAGALAGPR